MPDSSHDQLGLAVRNLTTYCRRSLHRLLSHVDVKELSDTQIAELEEFDFHHFAGIDPMRSITFINGRCAVRIIQGVRTGQWTSNDVLEAIKAT